MAQHSHVPKFGNWDSENVPYTTYFENARKEKGTGLKKMNPNDPEENPDAFTIGVVSTHENDHAVRPPPSRGSSGKMTHAAKRRNAPTRETVSLDQHNNGSRKTPRSKSGSDESSSDLSLIQRRARSNQRKSVGDSSNSYSSPSPATQMRTENNRAEETVSVFI
ncbi:hypothetical protein GIB67_026910 [Kingdonia uniflora]|uniref:RIN4 pathogenic type III effector avirulence factor Avr cleavage site domain-containing protein n=1 Tax=Kingdonia uniflora TaxID=39325 RepID=A0A7J7P1B2_9MAGN|nr:hypothetical protein GIB67_026910 [Kingdonia uniflora]